MKQKLLTDIELDVHELKCLMDSYAKEPTQTLSVLLKRSIQQMQQRLELLIQDLDADSSLSVDKEGVPITTETCETPDVAEAVKTPTIEIPKSPMKQASPMIQNLAVTQISSVIQNSSVMQDSSILEDSPMSQVSPIIEENIGEEVGPVCEEEDAVLESNFKPSILGESLKIAAGLRQSISLNDSFRFSRELFGGDAELMNRVIEQISVMSSYKTASAFLSSKVNINEENEVLNDLQELLKKYFNQSVS